MSLDLGETILQLDRVTRNLGRDYPDRRKPVNPIAERRCGGRPGGGPPQDRALL